MILVCSWKKGRFHTSPLYHHNGHISTKVTFLFPQSDYCGEVQLYRYHNHKEDRVCVKVFNIAFKICNTKCCNKCSSSWRARVARCNKCWLTRNILFNIQCTQFSTFAIYIMALWQKKKSFSCEGRIKYIVHIVLSYIGKIGGPKWPWILNIFYWQYLAFYIIFCSFMSGHVALESSLY